MKFLKDSLDLRMYQQTILGTAQKYNTLVVIPTGLGKTMVAVALSSLLYEKGKILVMAPTKPLCEQHRKTFTKYFNSKPGEMITITGETSPAKRKDQWEKVSIAFATPQTVENDTLRRHLNLKDFSLLVFDEAHRALGDYAYAWLAKQYNNVTGGRILALTASPASEKEKLDEICTNLGIQKVEVRTSDDSDVSPYVQEKEIIRVYVELPEKMIEIKKVLEIVLRDRLGLLKQAEVIESADPDKVRKTMLLQLQGTLAAKANLHPDAYQHMSLVAECIKLQHALELLQTQGITPLVEFFKKMEKQKTKSAKRLVTDWNFKKAMILSYDFRGSIGEHPKFEKLKEIVCEYVGKKIIIFTQYRSTVDRIVEVLKSISGAKPVRFVGQKGGVTQKIQIKTLEEFKDGTYNILCATQVSEEGIHVENADVGIFFEPVASPLRNTQRIGRIGRTNFGKIYVLIAKDTIDERYFWIAKHKEERMHEILENLKQDLGRQASLNEFK